MRSIIAKRLCALTGTVASHLCAHLSMLQPLLNHKPHCDYLIKSTWESLLASTILPLSLKNKEFFVGFVEQTKELQKKISFWRRRMLWPIRQNQLNTLRIGRLIGN